MQGLAKKHICVLGSANNDYFVYVNSIPTPGETIQSTNQMMANGGKGANQAVAAARLAGHSIFVGQVGNDQEKDLLEKEMTQSNVQLEWQIKQNSPTGKAIIMIDTKGENSIIIIGGANIDYDVLETLPPKFQKAIESADILLLQKEIPMKINQLAASLAKKLNKPVMLDCGGSDEEIPHSLLENLTFLSPNDTELLRIDPTIDQQDVLAEVRQKILTKYPGLTVVLKMGSKGARVINTKVDVTVTVASKLNPQVSQDFKIVDTVGAGDCFTSAFVAKYLQLPAKQLTDQDYRQCLMFANSSAFLCITKNGAMPSLPRRAEVDAFVQKYLSGG